MGVENTSYLLENLEKMRGNTSLTENLTEGEKNLLELMKQPNKWDQISMTNLYGTLVTCSVGVFTNILVATTLIVTWKFWRNSPGILLLTLACVDIAGNGVCFIYYLIQIYIQKVYFVLPPTFLYLNDGFKRLSYLMMIPISANRYALICRPFTHRRVTSQKSTLIQITTVCFFVFSTGIYNFMNRQAMLLYKLCHTVIDITMSTVLPFIISFVLTVLVICEFRRMNRTLEESVRTGANSGQGEKNITRAMIAVNVAFIVLTFPSMVTRVIRLFLRVLVLTDTWFILFQDINYSVNIFIYIICLPKI